MGDDPVGREMKESLAAADYGDGSRVVPAGNIKSGKSLVTLKDRAMLNRRLAEGEPDRITRPTIWRNDQNDNDLPH